MIFLANSIYYIISINMWYG